MGGATSTPTRPRDVGLPRLRWARAMRRVALGALALVVLAGLLNLLGVRTATAIDADGGYRLEVTYAAVTRSGLATPWTVEVSHQGGFTGPITIRMTADYFDRLDFNQWYPEPSSTTIDGDVLVLTFESPPGDVFTLRFDGRTSPTFSFGHRADTSFTSEGSPTLAVSYETVVMP